MKVLGKQSNQNDGAVYALSFFDAPAFVAPMPTPAPAPAPIPEQVLYVTPAYVAPVYVAPSITPPAFQGWEDQASSYSPFYGGGEPEFFVPVPAPLYVAPAPVYVAPSPVYIAPAPAYVVPAPAPVPFFGGAEPDYINPVYIAPIDPFERDTG